MKEPKAIMNIIVKHDGSVDFRSNAKAEDMIHLLGATQMVSKWLQEDISKMYNEYQKSPHKREELFKRKKLPKDKAVKHYLKLAQTIQERLMAMQQSDDNAVFEVPVDLLQEI